jgi:transposase
LWHGWLVGSGLLHQPILEPPVRATTLLNRVLDLPGLRVVGVDLDDPAGGGSVVIDVCLRRRVLACPVCSFTTFRRAV